MSRYALFALVAILGLALVSPAAIADDPPAPPVPPGGDDAAEKEAPLPKYTEIPTVKLVSAGAEPRTKLRYTPAEGATYEMSSTTTLNTKSMMGEMKIGPIKTTTKCVYGKGSKDGTLKLTAEITAATLEDDGTNPYAGMMKPGIEAQKGKKLTGELTDRGIWTADPAKAAGSDPMAKAVAEGIRTSMMQALPPLPEEAVGVGAKWTVGVRMVASNISQFSTWTLEVVKIEGSKVELKVTDSRVAKNSTMSVQGMQMTVKTLKGSGTGTMSVDTKIPGTTKASANMKTSMVMDAMGQEMENQSDVSISMTGKAVKSAAPVTTGG